MSLGLDLTNVADQNALPDGTYQVAVSKAEVKPTKTPGGEYIAVEYTVISGLHNGRKLFDQFNIKNANPQAVQIGLSQLKTLMKAGLKPNPNRLESSQELVGLKLRVKTKSKVDDFGEKAEVKAWLPFAEIAAIGDVQAQAPQPQQAAPQAAATANPFG